MTIFYKLITTAATINLIDVMSIPPIAVRMIQILGFITIKKVKMGAQPKWLHNLLSYHEWWQT
jgi:hypothetical protein